MIRELFIIEDEREWNLHGVTYTVSYIVLDGLGDSRSIINYSTDYGAYEHSIS